MITGRMLIKDHDLLKIAKKAYTLDARIMHYKVENVLKGMLCDKEDRLSVDSIMTMITILIAEFSKPP